MENLGSTLLLVLAAVVAFVGVFFALRQRQTLANIRNTPEMTSEDVQFWKRQTARRLFGSLLLLIFAGMMAGWFFIERDMSHLKREENGELSLEAKDSLRFISMYWIAALIILMGILFMAALDLIATVRYGLRSHRNIEMDRRAVLEEEAARLRRKKDEMN